MDGLALFLGLGLLGMGAMWLIVRLMLRVIDWLQSFTKHD
jgi:hypothetical protein